MKNLLILAACLTASCTAVAPPHPGDAATAVQPVAGPFEMRPFVEPVSTSFRFGSGLTNPVRAVVRNEDEWIALWDGLRAPNGVALLPPVDFEREMLLVAAMGARPTGGYSVKIVSAEDLGDEIEARVVLTSPGQRCGTTAAITEPADVVRVTRSDKPVRWVVRDEVSECP